MSFPRLHAIGCLLLLPLSTPVRADTVILSDGASVSGQIVDMRGGFLAVELAHSDGLALRRFPPGQVRSLAFDDSAKPLAQRALRRARFPSLLTLSDAQLLVDYLREMLEADDALAALAYAKQWHPKNRHPSLDGPYRSLLIEAALAADSTAEAVLHARSWLKRTPKPYRCELPWATLGRHYLTTEEPESALWIVLQPIAHAGNQDFPQLREIAAQSYLKLGYKHRAKALSSVTEDAPDQPLSPLALPSLRRSSQPFPQLLKTRLSE